MEVIEEMSPVLSGGDARIVHIVSARVGAGVCDRWRMFGGKRPHCVCAGAEPVGCGFCGCLICVTVASASAPDFMHARLCHSVVVA